MKKKLLQAMKSLSMLSEDKEKFVDIIVNNSNSRGGSKLKFLYFKNVYLDNLGFLSDMLIGTYWRLHINSIFRNNDSNVLIQNQEQVSGITKNCSIAVGDYVIIDNNVIPFYSLFSISGEEELVNVLKENEITEEEFFEGIEFGIPEM